ncbi:unnamed protein product [Clonostachys rhizophaga]|uniref:Heterokaryon incompatibility domain-containing protein n=1 Tax=Clonostachys rhizophaga TaxID=160324 RepID=A0A9N9VPP4_9HYPO|nr:unnamed protein product [Clonostachys rhizophaga]
MAPTSAEGASAGTFIYQPLNAFRQEIRLIEVLSIEEPIVCQLSVVSLLEKPRYSALSYVWGDAANKETIMVNGMMVPVTVNLKAALRHFGRHWKSFNPGRNLSSMRIWADALCINQNDTDEISSQVRLMERIYSCPDLVMAWLGSEDQKTSLALKMLCQFVEEFQAAKYDPKILADLHWLKNHPYLWQIEENTPEGNQVGNPVWDAIFFLNSLPYWRRVWTLQEQVLAPALVFSCPSIAVSGANIFNALFVLGSLRAQLIGNKSIPDFIPTRLWRSIGLPGHVGQDPIQHLVRVAMLYSTVYRAQRLPQKAEEYQKLEIERLEYLVRFPFEATEPKDHIYGILGLLNPRIKSKLKVDYSNRMTVNTLYLDFTSLLLEETKRLNSAVLRFLYLAGVGNDFGLPSWVPNYPAASKNVWHASWDTFAKVVPEEEARKLNSPSIRGLILSLSGARCLVVSRLGPKFSPFFSRENRYLVAELLKDSEPRFCHVWSFFRLALGITNETYVDDIWHFVLLLEFVQSMEKFLGDSCPSYLKGIALENTRGLEEIHQSNFQSGLNEHMVSLQMREKARGWVSSALAMDRNMVAFQTDENFLGVGPVGLREGDHVFSLLGFPSFAVLRKAGSRYRFVGPCNISERKFHSPGTMKRLPSHGGYFDLEIV